MLISDLQECKCSENPRQYKTNNNIPLRHLSHKGVEPLQPVDQKVKVELIDVMLKKVIIRCCSSQLTI